MCPVHSRRRDKRPSRDQLFVRIRYRNPWGVDPRYSAIGRSCRTYVVACVAQYRKVPRRGVTIADMQEQAVGYDRFERLVAVLFATIAVLGLVIVVAALVIFFPGSSGFDTPLP